MKRGVLYFFPLLCPLFLAGSDFFIRALPMDTLFDIEGVFRALSVSFLFGCFTIDIWGITSTLGKENAVALVWMLLLSVHLFLYGTGVYLNKYISIMVMTGDTDLSSYLLMAAVVVFSFLFLVAGREYCWKKLGV